MESTGKITINFEQEGFEQCISVTQYDTGKKVRCNIAGISGNIGAAMVYCKKPSGLETYTDADIVDDHTVEFYITEQMNAETGCAKCQLQLFGEDKSLTSYKFKILVQENMIASSRVTSADDYPAFRDAIEKFTGMTAEFSKKIETEKTERQSADATEKSERQAADAAEKTERMQEISVERARINNLVANNNPTEGNSELIDMRIGYDGTEYGSAGEAVRGQVSSLSEDIKDLGFDFLNLFDKDSEYVLKDKNVGGTGGSITQNGYDSANYYLTNIIKVSPGDIVRCNGTSYGNNTLFANLDGTITHREENNLLNGVTIPENCYFARFILTYNRSDLPSYDDVINSTVIVINRDLPEKYFPYGSVDNKKLIISYNQLINIPNMVDNQWNGLKCGCLGTSITFMGGWTDIVKSVLGFEKMYNRGLGGSTCADFSGYEGVSDYVTGGYVYSDESVYDESPDTVWCNSSEKNKKWVSGWYSSEDRINLLPSDCNLVLVDMCTNDFFRSFNKDYVSEADFISLPDVQTAWNESQTPTSWDDSKLGGAFMLMIKRIMTRCPNAKIVIWGMPYNNSISTSNGSAEHFYNIYENVKKMCMLTGVKFINTVEEMGVNVWNLTQYMNDGVHPATTEIGKLALALVLISHLKNIYPKNYFIDQ